MAKSSSAEDTASNLRPYALRRFDETPVERVAAGKAESPDVLLHRRENEAAERGYSDGFKKGMADAQARIDPVVDHLLQVVGELERVVRRKGEELLPHLVSLSIDVAEKVIHKALEVDKEIIVAIAQDGLSRIANADEQVAVRVNPEDYAALQGKLALLKEASGLKNISIEPHESINPGGCYIEAVSGSVDARIDEQIKEVSGAIRTALDS
ncbi:MAG: flagellar assembly protein FliH [Nitrospirae bacterium]|nr:MAG: flagellar assembly protein FliH [Nitrospirota bacterium]